ncbi:MAG: response regulator transcription factor [Ferruginibacter sp.]|nr:response regulator transcription factor [Ferruginibacter sp.]
MKILIADDHSVVRKGLKQILLEGFPSAEIAEVADAESLVSQVVAGKWDVVISDISMPKRTGLDVLPQIKNIDPKLPVLILSIHPEEQYAVRVLKSGASGYLSKDTAPDELVNAVKQLILGKKYINSSVAEKIAGSIGNIENKPPHEMLSDREFSVFKLLASGKSITEIAESFLLSTTTVSTYRARILNKLNLKNNTEMTLYCLENKLM